MQDNETGELVKVADLTQEAFDAAIPDRKKQGAVFSVGEIVSVKGGTFRVHSFGRKMLVLEGVPGTKINSRPAGEV